MLIGIKKNTIGYLTFKTHREFGKCDSVIILKKAGKYYVSFSYEMNTRDVGMAVVELDGGRKVASDTIDYRVGFTEVCRLGDRIDSSEPIAMLLASSEASWNQAADMFRGAFTVRTGATT